MSIWFTKILFVNSVVILDLLKGYIFDRYNFILFIGKPVPSIVQDEIDVCNDTFVNNSRVDNNCYRMCANQPCRS